MTRAGTTAVLLFVACFALGAMLEPKLAPLPIYRRHSGTPLETALGDGRLLFANHFYTKADAYFHRGFYPTIFDNRHAFQAEHMAADAGAIEEPGASRGADFLGRPKDWIEKLGRSFFPSEHTHLQHGAAGGEHSAPPAQPDVREMLPWLRLTVALDPHKTEVYTVAAYWLRSQMGKVDEAEEFLLEGLRNNSNSYPILFELGRIAAENRQDSGRARNLWEEALSQWKLQNAAAEEPDNFRLSQICLRLAILERDSGNFSAAEAYLKMVQAVSPNPAEVQKRIDELRLEAEKPR